MKLIKRQLMWTQSKVEGHCYGSTHTTNILFVAIYKDKKVFKVHVLGEGGGLKKPLYKTLRAAKIAANRYHMEYARKLFLSLLNHVTGDLNLSYGNNISGRTGTTRKGRKNKGLQTSLPIS
jgi:hypothetical protein